jgi:hypothetical protein
MKLLITLIALASSIISGAAKAEDTPVKKARWYQVNVTFFQQKHDRSLDESFSFEKIDLSMGDVIQLHEDDNTFLLPESGLNAALSLHNDNANALPYTIQNISEEWTDIIEKLDPVKQVILYNAQWIQPVYEQQHSLPIYFESSQQVLNQPQLKGLFHVHVSRYLHTNIELQYLTEQASSIQETLSLQQSRRMRSKELHYIDHPSIGVLIKIIPTEHPLDKQETDTPIQPDSIPIESALNARI